MPAPHDAIDDLNLLGPFYQGGRPSPAGAAAAPTMDEIIAKLSSMIANDTSLVDLQDDVGNTALHLCAKQLKNEFDTNDGKRKAASVLIEAGADLTLVDQFGQTALCLSAMTEEPNGGITKLLCDGGARVDLCEPQFGNTALHWAAFGGLPQVLEPMLTASGMAEAFSMQNKEGKTPLMLAKERANPKSGYPYKSCSELVKTLETFAKKKQPK